MDGPWQVVSSVPSLPPGVIHVWRADVESLLPCVPYFDSLLDGGERVRGDAFHRPVDRMRHVVTRGVLRFLTGRYLDVAPRSLQFGAGAFGKPNCTSSESGHIVFNLSHSGDVVLIAFARDGDLGVDVERWNPRLEEKERRRITEVCSIAERMGIERLPSAAERERAFYSLWTRKEAYLKGAGTGISEGLSHVDVSVDEVARLVEDRRDALAVERWAMHDLDVGPGYTATLAASPSGRELTLLLASPNLFDG
jgi:4'-phosphopantetheinyl transferase